MINELYTTDMPYYLVLGKRFLYGKAVLASIQATLYRKQEMDDTFLKVAVDTGKSILWLKYDSSEENTRCESLLDKIGDSDSWIVSYNIYGNEMPDGTSILTPDKACDELTKIIARNELFMFEQGLFITDYHVRCGNCNCTLEPDERYCRICGTKRGEGRFEPENNEFFGIYAPSIWTRYQCNECGKTWEGTVFSIYKSCFCPQCGKKTLPVVERSIQDMMEECLKQKDQSDV